MHVFDEDNLVAISLTVNACTLTYILGGRVIGLVSMKYQERYTCWKHMLDLHTRKPWLAGRLLTEQLLLVILCIMSVIALGTSSAAELPFVGVVSQTMDPVPRLLMCINIGRYVFMSIQDLLLLRHLHNFKTDLIHHVVTVVACSIFLAYKQNIFISIATPLMELNLLVLTSGRIMRDIPEYRDSKMYRNTTVLSCAATMVCRGVLPVIFLAIAVKHDSPFNMKVVPVTLFFLCIVFFFVINFWMIFQTASRVVKLWAGDKENQSSSPGIVLSNPTEPQLYDVTIGSVDGEGRTKPFPLSNVNYGFVKSYDNRNLCNNDNEKMNFGIKKLTKHNLVSDLTDIVSYTKVPNSPTQVTFVTEIDDVLHIPQNSCVNEDDVSTSRLYTDIDENGVSPVQTPVCSAVTESPRSTSSEFSELSTSSSCALIESVNVVVRQDRNGSRQNVSIDIKSQNDSS